MVVGDPTQEILSIWLIILYNSYICNFSTIFHENDFRVSEKSNKSEWVEMFILIKPSRGSEKPRSWSYFSKKQLFMFHARWVIHFPKNHSAASTNWVLRREL